MVHPKNHRRTRRRLRLRVLRENGDALAGSDRTEPNRIHDITPDGETLRSPGKIVARHPGHMVHMDVKQVGKLRDSGAWWAHGRGSVQHKKKHADHER